MPLLPLNASRLPVRYDEMDARQSLSGCRLRVPRTTSACSLSHHILYSVPFLFPFLVEEAIEALSNAIDDRDSAKVLACLRAPVLELEGVEDGAAAHYLTELSTLQEGLPEGEFFTIPQAR